jgi:SAM-dependent methyltransferase
MPNICDYEGSSYREEFWEKGNRAYEDLAERIALRRLLPPTGGTLMEIGAGFGRLADLYSGYRQVVLLDYARSMLEDARKFWGDDPRFLFVAADLYHLPFTPGSFHAITMVRVLHHVQDVPSALAGIRRALADDGVFVLEHANKRNLKAIARYLLRKQSWNPFDREPVEFVPLNYDFHPAWVREEMARAGFVVREVLSVSHFRHALIKRVFPPDLLARADGAVQRIGALWSLTPSLFLRAEPTGSRKRKPAPDAPIPPKALFRCPKCGGAVEEADGGLRCVECGRLWPLENGIYDFRPVGSPPR